MATKDYSAPGSLELVRRFVNSLDLDHPDRDPFLVAASANDWLRAFGSGSIRVDEPELAALRDLREALRSELTTHADPDERSAWDGVARRLAGTAFVLASDNDANVHLAPLVPTGLEAIKATIAASVYDSLRSGDWLRLKACRKASCRFAFYDRSKNGSATWCDMAICGNREKASRRRARQRSVGE